MLTQTTYDERQHNDSAAQEARSSRQAAEAVNAIFSLAQANVLRLACDAMPEVAVLLAEQAFEAYGWPADGVDTAWLDEAGRITWAIFKRYREAV